MSSAIILAAGMGKRMKSPLPKVLHPVLGKPMVQRVAEAAEAAGVRSIRVVVGHGRDLVIPMLEERSWSWAVQEEQLGTAHAVSCAMPLDPGEDQVAVLLGDVPLLKRETIARLMEARSSSGASMAVLTTTPPDVTGYGRVIMDPDGRIERIVEEKDATDQEKAIRTINTGIMAFSVEALEEVLPLVGRSNAQGEYYLTDAVAILREKGRPALSVFTPDWEEVAGVNHPLQLARCTDIMKKRVTEDHLLSGVIIPDPSTVWIEDSVTIGAGAVIGRNCTLSGETVIGAGAVIGQGAVIRGAVIPAGDTVGEYEIIEAEDD
ncbi:MAG TPA: NTP transferase domain-containing protein [Candidatus Sabulitectum sp.]|nr:NTP transferase domain-containing protein [Candidatus Sabulitectum sp.]HPR21843.1 NTP transferase domain-containing protein [Candidatus Sabulitectum sp.]